MTESSCPRSGVALRARLWVATGRTLIRLDPATGTLLRAPCREVITRISRTVRQVMPSTPQLASSHGQGPVITERNPDTGAGRAGGTDRPSIRGGALPPQAGDVRAIFPTGMLAAAYRLRAAGPHVAIAGPEIGTNATAQRSPAAI
jgi:hypothetical protein